MLTYTTSENDISIKSFKNDKGESITFSEQKTVIEQTIYVIRSSVALEKKTTYNVYVSKLTKVEGFTVISLKPIML